MIAELHNKISKNNSNLFQLSEDELTGNFFGHLRYIPFEEGLKPILKNAVFPLSIVPLLDSIDAGFWDNYIEFWPYDREGELDVYLEFDRIAIGIEVKYTSGLSSDDDIDYSIKDAMEKGEQSCNQLQRESRIIARRAPDKTKILLLAGDAMACADIYKDINQRKLLTDSDVHFGYVSWQYILRELRRLNPGNLYSSLVISDLIHLLEKKGFDHFQTMAVDLSYTVYRYRYYEFKYNVKNGFTFESNVQIKVKGDYFYEFR